MINKNSENLQKLSIFDIAGPIMVGPSSSHTAGACKIGQFARAFFNTTPKKVVFYLHGSFGEVFKGHATDRALLAGVMKFRTSDPRIKDSFKIAKQKNIKYEFIKKNLGSKYHPNTVKIILYTNRKKLSVIGSSVGGGVIEIVKIDNFNIHLSGRAGKYLSLIVLHNKDKKIIETLENKIKKLEGVRINSIDVKDYKNKTLTVFNVECRRIRLEEVLDMQNNTKGVDFIRSLSKLENQNPIKRHDTH